MRVPVFRIVAGMIGTVMILLDACEDTTTPADLLDGATGTFARPDNQHRLPGGQR